MRILITAYDFYPNIGGTATASRLLAAEFSRRGHSVVLVTRTTRKEADDDLPFKVLRQPGPIALIRAILWSEVVLNIHISLRLTWPLFFMRHPWVVAHHSWITRVDGSLGWQDYVKRVLLHRAHCISVSQAVALHVSTPSIVIGPPYSDSLFKRDESVSRDQDIVFVGRLVSSKGMDVLLAALNLLRIRGLSPKLTVVGSGPEGPKLEEMVAHYRLQNQVQFVGAKGGKEMVRILNSHKIMVIPSTTRETFGIVALEGIACGCAIVASDERGGLGDAVGRCGLTFPAGDAVALAARLFEIVSQPAKFIPKPEVSEVHLDRFRLDKVADSYLEVIQNSVSGNNRSAFSIKTAALLAGYSGLL